MANLGFSTMTKRKAITLPHCQCGKVIAQNIYITVSGYQSLSQSLDDTYRVHRGRWCRISCWNFDAVCRNSDDISIFGFRGHVFISGCRPLLQAHADISFDLFMVVNPRLAVGILILSYAFRDITYKYFRCRRPSPVVGHYWSRLVLVMVENPSFAVRILMRYVSTSSLGGYIAIFCRPLMCVYLWPIFTGRQHSSAMQALY